MLAGGYASNKTVIVEMNTRTKHVALRYAMEKTLPQFDRHSKVVNLETLKAIFNIEVFKAINLQIYMRTIRIDVKKDDTRYFAVLEYIEKHETSFYDGCIANGFSSFKFARLYLEKNYAYSFFGPSVPSFVKNSSAVEDKEIRDDLLRCISSDSFATFENHLIQQLVGKDCDEVIASLLGRCRAAFGDDRHHHGQNSPGKVPDIVFNVPILVNLDGEEYSLHWLDSRALFVDADTYFEGLDQYGELCSHYGRGLVVYWRGFIGTGNSSMRGLFRSEQPSGNQRLENPKGVSQRGDRWQADGLLSTILR